MPLSSNSNVCYQAFTSIVNIGNCLSNLIDIQAYTIRCLTSAESESAIPNIIDFNKSVEHILKDICMLQMLLQLKLENINNITRVSSDPFTDEGINALSAIKEMADKARKNLFELASFKKSAKILNRCIRGRAHGQILNKSDPFYNGIAVMQVYIDDSCIKENFLCYSAVKGTTMMIFTAYTDSLITSYEVTDNYKRVKIEGIGSIVIKEGFKPDKRDIGVFESTIYFDTKKNKKNFKINIKSTNNDNFSQASGKIEAKCSNFQIKLE